MPTPANGSFRRIAFAPLRLISLVAILSLAPGGGGRAADIRLELPPPVPDEPVRPTTPMASPARQAATPAKAAAPSECCGRPGMIPVCRCVPVTKKRTRTEYDTKCELVCVPGCSLLRPHPPGVVKPGCCDDGCPACGNVHIREKHTLLKRVREEEYDSFEYRIEWVCAACVFGTGCTAAPGAASDRAGPADHARRAGLCAWLVSGGEPRSGGVPR